MVNTEGLKKYLREEEEEDLELYLNAAKRKAQLADVEERENDPMYDLFIYALAAHLYENRGLSTDTEAQNMINSFVLALR